METPERLNSTAIRFRKQQTSTPAAAPLPRSADKTPEKNNVNDIANHSMTPNTRKRKSRLSEDLTTFISELELDTDDQVDVITLSLKKLGILDQFNFTRKPTKSGRKLLPFEVRKAVWDFWHEKGTASTLTSRPAKLRAKDKPKVQANLEFIPTTTMIVQRKVDFYQSNWSILNETYKVLYHKFLNISGLKISYGAFISLKPFYIRPATPKDLEMCCCKKHLHARWSIKALIDNCNKQKIDLGDVKDYSSFFTCLTKKCGKEEESTYISWKCTPDKVTLCNDIKKDWKTLKTKILERDDKKTSVPMQHFELLEMVTRKGKQVTRLKAVSTPASLEFITQFIEKQLASIIHHRNQLKHYRKTLSMFKERFDTILLDVDFSENLSIPVKYEPQSLHWSHQQVTVHSGISKIRGEKSYHAYVSDDLKHDQHFVQVSIMEMLKKCGSPKN
ncbi:uncharacterized protein [Clytia hemisphaerica]|uniref:uncharacterized protein n=1 Tax=Clytia hemisphaerica TaxID=252671 RepID=UPI0034D6F9BE